MFRGGYLTVAHVRGALLRVHFSAPLGAVVFGRFAVVPGFWLAFLVLVMLHELGHAVMVWGCGARVLACDMTGLGGTCTYEGEVSDVQSSVIAWGGVLAQMVVFVVARVAIAVAAPQTAFGAQIADACLEANVWVAIINLMPVPPLDGASAWRLFPRLWRRARQNRVATKMAAARASTARLAAHDALLRLEELDDVAPDPELDATVAKILTDAARKR